MTITDERATMTCSCRFTGDVGMHDRMLSFESLDPVEAALMVAEFILGESFVIMCSSSVGDPDPSDFEQFVMQHNWKDPVAMTQLAGYVEPAAHRVHEHDRERRR